MEIEEFYRQEFLRFENGRMRETKSLDNAIFWISTGTLVLSINYIIGLKEAKLIMPYLLIFSWLSFLLSIFTHLIGYQISKSYHDQVICELKYWARNKFNPIIFKYSERVTRYLKWSDRLSNFSLYFLIIGLTAIALFTTVNFLYLQSKVV